jgi:glycogen debranching enzyme
MPAAGKANGKGKGFANGKPRPDPIAMPKPQHRQSTGPKTPKTPQDEAIAFFTGEGDGDLVQVWELWLEDDGGPDAAKSVSRSYHTGVAP